MIIENEKALQIEEKTQFLSIPLLSKIIKIIHSIPSFSMPKCPLSVIFSFPELCNLMHILERAKKGFIILLLTWKEPTI